MMMLTVEVVVLLTGSYLVGSLIGYLARRIKT